ncbi:MAG: coproporphyrinogen dehydrogenase HemZ [Lawsonibacter sp.]|nr:coproporphyrinogen dehydrogenase HemZ [Lawsonibacter sp.]
MKLYLEENKTPWQGMRYRYAVEQMMLMLFPGEKPEYPAQLPRTLEGEDNAAVFTLSRGETWTTVTALVLRPQGQHSGVSRLDSLLLDQTPEQVYHVVQHALKMAFYKAGTALLGYEPPWGALTGVRPVKLPTRAIKRGATPAQAKRELEREYRVSPVRAQLALDCAQASLSVDRTLTPNQVSLYLGIPFCPTRCAYCSFVSADVSRTLKLVEPYLQAMLRELDAAGRAMEQTGLSIRSLYMGGGTPTTLSADQMDRLLSRCREVLPLDSCTEYTVEAGRPDTITREKLEVLAKHGIGRISINPQTLEDPVLAAIGRKHLAADIYAAYELAREIGFSCINMDLIAGLPRDSFDGFCRSLQRVLGMGPENITVHTLALKKGSTLMEQGGTIPSGAEVARMLDCSLLTLRGAGYLPYYLYRQKYMSGSLENVGWAKPGTESLYNIVMMEELQTVVSIGGGGVTKLVDPKAGRIVRLPNPKYPHDYLAALDKVIAQKMELSAFYQ